MEPREMGFRVAAMEIASGTASFVQAQQRGIFPISQEKRMEWDWGYDDCVCAHRLGHDVQAMVQAEMFGPSLMSLTSVVMDLLDGTWPRTRPDPRRR